MKELTFDSRRFLSGQTKPLSVGVFGSRSLKDERVKMVILEKLIELNATKVVTAQEPQGVCEVAQRICKDYGYPLQLHFLNMKYLRGCFEQRSKEIIHASDFIIIIHDGKSKGTANEKILADKLKIPYHYEIIEPSQYERSVGFNIMKEWGDGKDESTEWQ